MLQFTSFAFDAGLEKIFIALLHGATLVLRGEEAWDTADLASRIARWRIAVANLPSSYWASWVAALQGAFPAAAGDASPPPDARHRTGGPPPSGELPASLRLLIAGGEAMPAAALAGWHGSPLAGVRLLNAYGPTEAVVTATLYELPPPLPAPPRRRSSAAP